MTELDQTTIDEINSAEPEAGPYHTILEVWQTILAPARDQIGAAITPQWANRMVQTYPQVTYADTPALADMYYERIGVLADILASQILGDSEALKVLDAAEDLETNHIHYLQVIVDWQKQFLQWELDWRPDRSDAAIDIASLSEVHKMFFDQTGLLSLLEQINFEFTDGDRDMLAIILQEMREGTGE
jgi:hypothetical protein